MKALDLKLLESTGNTYDQTRTTLAGRVTQRTIDSKPVLGPSPTRFLDVFTDTGLAPVSTMFGTDNGRLFCIAAITGGALPVFCYEVDQVTGVSTYVGRINLLMPQGPVQTIRSIKVVDSGTTGWKVYVIATGTGTIGGSGVLLANNISRSDFSQVSPPTINFATGNNQKAIYQLGRLASLSSRIMTVTLGTPVKFNLTAHGFQNNDQVYFTSQVGTNWSASTFAVNTKYFVRNAGANDFELSATFNGSSIGAAAGPTSVVMQTVNQEIDAFGAIIDITNNRLYTHVGTAANSQYFVRNISVAPTYSTLSVDINAGSPGKILLNSHGLAENEPVQFLAGILPAAFTLNTVYFVKNVTANDFELSATAGAASINVVGSVTGVTLGKAFGYTNSQWLHKTSILPTISGTLLATTDSEARAVPVNAPLNGSLLNGQHCAFFATTTNIYLGRLDELTSETSVWPSLTTSNVLGSLNQITAPVVVAASWSDALDNAIIFFGVAASNAYRFMLKKVENNKLTSMFGESGSDYYEATARPNFEIRFAAPAFNFSNTSGWIFVGGSTAGQRGIVALDACSDAINDFSYAVSKVISLPQNSVLKAISVYKELAETSGEVVVYYRTSGFSLISGGWTLLDSDQTLSIPAGGQIQFKILYKTTSIGHSSHVQVSGASIEYESQEELSDNWEYSFDDSSSGSPTRCGFRLKQTYPVSVPSTLTFKASDLSGTLLVSDSISAQPTRFQYSTDNGNTWLSLGTIPNVVGTLVRYTFTSPPGTDVRPTLKDN